MILYNHCKGTVFLKTATKKPPKNYAKVMQIADNQREDKITNYYWKTPPSKRYRSSVAEKSDRCPSVSILT